MENLANSSAVLMVVLVAGMLWGEWTHRRAVYGLFKMLGAALFLAVAFRYGLNLEGQNGWFQAGFVAAAIGDAFLISSDKKMFKIGILAFLLGHVLYMVGVWGLPRDFSTLRLLGLSGVVLFTVIVIGFLWKKLSPSFRPLVSGYILVLSSLMALTSISHPMMDSWGPFFWSITFAASDLCVARNRFIQESPWNRVVGLPLYFGAQLYLAWQFASWMTAQV